MAGVVAGVGLYTFWYAQGFSYMSNDPAACMNCHIMREHYDSWAKGSHHAAAGCNDCHVPHGFPAKYIAKMDNGFNHSVKFTLQNFEEPIRIRPVNLARLQQNCIDCHEMAVSEIAAHQDVDDKEARCTDCHRSVGHMALD
ncbi:MAG: cytochrome c nitrite reductase small subunit [Candidatus Omnitrophica bacterium]|nr:cytochrome c nitrite reductase small subunit [Candidatus Omnitrophota bacterium]